MPVRDPRDPHKPLPNMEHLPGCAYDHAKPYEHTGSCVPDCPIGGYITRKRLIKAGLMDPVTLKMIAPLNKRYLTGPITSQMIRDAQFDGPEMLVELPAAMCPLCKHSQECGDPICGHCGNPAGMDYHPCPTCYRPICLHCEDRAVKKLCRHDRTHMQIDPTEPTQVGPTIEVCDDCGMSRSHWEQGASPWLMVEECGHIDKSADGRVMTVCCLPKGHAGKHAGMGLKE